MSCEQKDHPYTNLLRRIDLPICVARLRQKTGLGQFEFWNAWIPCCHWDTEHFSMFWLFKTVIFRSFPFVSSLCLGILKRSACLALSFETIYSHLGSEMRPNAYQRSAAKWDQFLRVQRLRPDFVLRCCSIIRIMLTNVATSNTSTSTLYGTASAAVTKWDQQQQQQQQRTE